MATTPEQLDLWRGSASEHPRLEFKEAKEQYDNRKLYEYCVAMANEGGGYLLRVLVFHIPSRPRGTAYHLDGTYLIRSGESLVPMSEDQLRRIFAEGQPDWLEEHTVPGLDAQQVVELLDTQTLFDLFRSPYPTERRGVIDRLLRERLLDESAGTYAIRRLGALLFAKRLSDFQDLARKAPRVVVYSGVSKLETRLDQTGALGYAVGFQRLIAFIMSQLPQNEVISGLIKADEKVGGSRKYARYLPFWA